MDTTQILIICLLVTASVSISLFIRKLLFEKDHVRLSELNSVKDECNQLKTQFAVSENALNTAKEEGIKLAILYEAKSKEVEKLYADLAERTTEKGNLDLDVMELKLEIHNLKQTLEEKNISLQKANDNISNLNAELRFKQEKLDTQKQELEGLGEKFESTFKVLANSILDDKSQKFTEQQEANLKSILQPLKEHIQNFKQEFDAKFSKESEERISLTTQVKMMMELNNTLSEQANNLTQALRGNVKQQGNWGEMILESILQYSGLQKNIQYFIQERSQNDEGNGIQPDVIVKYPDNRAIVIDSKVSLLHYERFCAATSKEQEEHLLQLLLSFKSHIDGLTSKAYHTIENVLDNVVMFVPVEGAYITAMNADPELWQYAYKKGILLISPSNLILALKLVKDMWQKDAIDQNAQEIAKRASKMYDKLAGFIDTFEKVGTNVEKALGCWQDAKKQLHTGRSNVLSQAEQMKKLHVRTSKQLPQTLIESALLEDGHLVEENAEEETIVEQTKDVL
jgi:DNA recombination protein RmuC